jgi:hypothetical protein
MNLEIGPHLEELLGIVIGAVICLAIMRLMVRK